MEKFGYKVKHLEKFIDAKLFAEKYVDVPRFIKFCENCSEYSKSWSCPAYNFDTQEFWKKYKTVRLIGEKITLSDGLLNMKYTDEGISEFVQSIYIKEKSKLTKYVMRLEKKHAGSRALSSLICSNCKNCARLSGKPCRHPDKMRHMIEGLGADVEKAAVDFFDTKILWTENDKLPEYYVIFFALLMKD